MSSVTANLSSLPTLFTPLTLRHGQPLRTVDIVPQAPEDPLCLVSWPPTALMLQTKKVDLGIGAYRDDNAKPWSAASGGQEG